METVINKFKNTKSYLDNFSQEVAKLLRIEIGRNRKRRSMNPRGRNITAPIDSSGRLRESISIESKEGDNNAIYNIEALSYGLAVDKGRKPNQKPPSSSAILQWIKDKPVRLRDAKGKMVSMNNNQKKGLAGVIARSIGFYGIAPTNFISEALEASMGKLDALGSAVGQDVMENVEDILLKAGYIKKGDNYEIRKE